MKASSSRSSFAFALLLAVGASAAVACGGSDDTDDSGTAAGSGGAAGKAGGGGKAGQGGGVLGGSGGATGGAGGKAGAAGKAGAGGGSAGAGASCGNGKKDGTEQCDGKDLAGQTCATFTKDPKATGTLSCNNNCTINGGSCKLSGQGGASGSSGASGAGGATNCGNGKVDPGEKCDGADLGGATCATATGMPGSTGALSCFANCTFNVGMCSLAQGGMGGAGGAGGAMAGCGDGVKNGLEQCDGADVGGATCPVFTGDPNATGTVTCFPNCALDLSGCMFMAGTGGAAGSTPANPCGDGVKNATEQCDGTSFGTATCATSLSDPGATGNLACFGNCTIDASGCAFSSPGGPTSGGSVCGDGVKNGSEVCDGADVGGLTCAVALGDANATGSITCNANCTLSLTGCSTPPPGNGSDLPKCGDGVKAGYEQCDGADVGAVTCATAVGPGSTGTIGCFANCTIDATACSVATGSGGTGGAGGAGGTGQGGSAGAPTCNITPCLSKVYECGDCVDNDGDGKVDMDDPDCLGPCDNNEKGYFLNIPGANNAPCKADCYFDYDSGSGNDDCYWNHQCDSHEVKPNYYPESANGSACAYDPKASTPGTNKSCDQLYNSQSQTCHSYCGPLTPNGCDCFGCCELPAGSGSYVYLGSVDSSGNGTCDLEHVNDPSKCQPCTPVKDCLNTCEKCELCLGKTTLPPECLPPSSSCGDGKKDAGEQCDGADLGGATCASVTGIPSSTGTVSCSANCTLNGGMCSIPTNPTPVCGDGIKTGFEQCDGADIGGVTCAQLTGNPLSTGQVTCAANCTLDGLGCTNPGGGVPLCGNGVKDGIEQCDLADLGGATCATVTGNPGATGTLTCATNCTLDGVGCMVPPPTGGGGVCGDAVKNGTEQCDGADLGGATCAIVLGNPNATGTLKCFGNCLIDSSGCSIPTGSGGSTGASCGDMVKNGTEQCDTADLGGATCISVLGNPNAIGTLTCFPNCLIDSSGCSIPTGSGGSTGTPMCGNSIKEGTEQCDGTDLGGATCASVLGNSSATGTLKCFGNCTIDSSGCGIPTGGGGGSCGGQVCGAGVQACGLACQPACPSGQYCLTGCCTQIIK